MDDPVCANDASELVDGSCSSKTKSENDVLPVDLKHDLDEIIVAEVRSADGESSMDEDNSVKEVSSLDKEEKKLADQSMELHNSSGNYM